MFVITKRFEKKKFNIRLFTYRLKQTVEAFYFYVGLYDEIRGGMLPWQRNVTLYGKVWLQNTLWVCYINVVCFDFVFFSREYTFVS